MGTLFLIATPIGNLDDVTLRAIAVLNGVDYILCEDTRVTKVLLDHYKISKTLISYHHHSDARKLKEIRELLNNGHNIALVSDAGTPGISDPGNELICYLLKYNQAIEIVPIPGPSAVIAALSISGFPTDKFIFMGFPPHKNKRQKFFQEAADAKYTVVFYESGHRIKKCLTELAASLQPNTEIVIGRELTKKFETIYRLKTQDLATFEIDDRGEFVVIISK